MCTEVRNYGCTSESHVEKNVLKIQISRTPPPQNETGTFRDGTQMYFLKALQVIFLHLPWLENITLYDFI